MGFLERFLFFLLRKPCDSTNALRKIQRIARIGPWEVTAHAEALHQKQADSDGPLFYALNYLFVDFFIPVFCRANEAEILESEPQCAEASSQTCPGAGGGNRTSEGESGGLLARTGFSPGPKPEHGGEDQEILRPCL